MTYQELIVDLYERLGEPSNYLPYDDLNDEATFNIAATGAIKLGKLVNRAYKKVMSWKYPDGRILRFRNGYTWAYATAPFIQLTNANSSGRTVTVDGPGANEYATRFLDWTLSVDATGEAFRVVNCAYAAPTYTLTLHTTPATALSASAVSLTKNFLRFVASPTDGYADNINLSGQQVNSVVKLRDLEQNTDLVPKDRVDLFTTSGTEIGVPSQYYSGFCRILFDRAPDAAYTYQILYKQIPASMTTATEEPLCTAPFHDAIIWAAVADGRDLMQDFDGAYAAKRNLEDLMNRLVHEEEVALENELLGWEALI